MVNMKRFTEYIRISKYVPIQKGSLIRNDIINFYGESIDDTCPDNLIDEVVNYYKTLNNSSGFDFILETLNSHDFSKISKKLQEFLGSSLISIEKNNDDETIDSFEIILKYDDELANIIKGKKFLSIIEFYGYYISGIYGENGLGDISIFKLDKIHNLKDYILTVDKQAAIILTIEPKYSKNADVILNKSHNICYHFTDNKSAESILKNGLRCKSGSYREYPERIYLYCDLYVTDKNMHLRTDIKNMVDIICDHNMIRKYGLAVLKIDLNHIGVSVYRDTMMIDDNKSVFTYTNIPADSITKIDIR